MSLSQKVGWRRTEKDILHELLSSTGTHTWSYIKKIGSPNTYTQAHTDTHSCTHAQRYKKQLDLLFPSSLSIFSFHQTAWLSGGKELQQNRAGSTSALTCIMSKKPVPQGVCPQFWFCKQESSLQGWPIESGPVGAQYMASTVAPALTDVDNLI